MACLGCHTASKFEFGAWERHGRLSEGATVANTWGRLLSAVSSAIGAIAILLRIQVSHAFYWGAEISIWKDLSRKEYLIKLLSVGRN